MATLLDSYSESNQSNQWSVDFSDHMAGQSFKTPNDGINYVLDSCKFYLKEANNPTGSVYVRIYAHTGTYGTSSLPTGSVLATSDAYNSTGLTTSFQLIDFTFSGANRITLSANTAYCIEVYWANSDGSTSIKVGNDNSSPTAGGNSNYYVGNTTWTAYNTVDTCFYVYGQTPSNIKTYNTNARANIKTINTNAIANVKTLNTNA